MTALGEIISLNSSIEAQEVALSSVNSPKVLEVPHVSSLKSYSLNHHPLKIYLFGFDTQFHDLWFQCARSQVNSAPEIIAFAQIPQAFPYETGLVVIDRNVAQPDTIRQIGSFCQTNRRQQVVVIGDRLGVDEAVELMRAGVKIVYERPLDRALLERTLPSVIQQAQAAREEEAEFLQLERLFQSLTYRESQVLKLVLDGMHNRCSAERLEVSVRTIEARRAKVYRKLECSSLVELVRKMDRLEQLRPIFGKVSHSDHEVSSSAGHPFDRITRDGPMSERL